MQRKKEYEFTTADPQSNYPDDLERFRKEMKENGWDEMPEEELFEFAMHESQYRDYKSGAAKKRFLEDLQKAKDAKAGAGMTPEQISELKHAKADPVVARESGRVLWGIQGEGVGSSGHRALHRQELQRRRLVLLHREHARPDKRSWPPTSAESSWRSAQSREAP